MVKFGGKIGTLYQMLKNAFKKHPLQNRTNVQIKGGGGQRPFEQCSKKLHFFEMRASLILEDFVKRANSNIDGNFLLLATALDPRWKDLKVITKESRDRAFGRLKNEMMSLQPSTSSGTEQEQQSKPKRRLLDFDASDESIEEEDELDAELSRLLIDKLSICNL